MKYNLRNDADKHRATLQSKGLSDDMNLSAILFGQTHTLVVICPKSWKHALPPLHNSTCPHPSYPPTDNIAADSIIGRIKQRTMDSKFQQVSFQNLWKAQWSEWLQLPCSMVWCNSRPCPVEPKQLYELYQTSQPSLHIESHSAFLTQSLEDLKISHIITLKAPQPSLRQNRFHSVGSHRLLI